MIPDSIWSFEMHEAWIDSRGNPSIEIDFENESNLNHHPQIAGSFFAAKLSVAEYLYKLKRKASIIIIREIYPEYILPVGVWQIREGIREALRGKYNQFGTFDAAFSDACNNLSTPKKEWVKNSQIYKTKKYQIKISNYF
jgi:hypothetical protein